MVEDGTVAYVQLDDPGLVAEIDTSNADAYPLPDALGTARLMTDDTATVAGTSDYDAFGNPRASSGTQGRLGWDGELRDPATGLTHLRARDYAPATGRFTTRDTVSPNGPGTQGYNPYANALNNPATLTDPSGHEAAVADIMAAAQTTRQAVQDNPAQVATTLTVLATVRAMVPSLLAIAVEVIFMIAVAIVVIVLILAVVHLVSELVQWCKGGGCAEAFGGAWSWLKAQAGVGWSTVETGLGVAADAAKEAAENAACNPSSVGEHGEFVNPEVPEQCKQPCSETAEATSTSSSDGVELELKYKSGWTDEQKWQANAKVDYLDDAARRGELRVKPSPERNKNKTKAYRKDCPPPALKCHVDHMVDLQLGGQDIPENFWYLDGSVNMSLGAQIHGCIKDLPEGTPVLGVYVSGP